jgi:hypothetical protein
VEKRKWNCIGECRKDFGVGEWECAPGIPHTVEPKEYYILDAPQGKHDPTGASLRNATTTVENCPPERTVKDSETGELKRVPGGNVKFVRGYAKVNDAEKQFWLERHGFGSVPKSKWEEVYFSGKEKDAMREAKLKTREAEIAKKEAEVNELLASVKASKKEPAKAHA